MERASAPEEQVRALLRTQKLRVTDARVRVLATLMQAQEPLTIEELAARIAGVHFVTIYRVLEQFERTGLVYRADFRSGKASYEYQPHHHHHVTCSGCGTREAVSLCIEREASRVLAEAQKFATVDSHVLEFFGVCTECKSRER